MTDITELGNENRDVIHGKHDKKPNLVIFSTINLIIIESHWSGFKKNNINLAFFKTLNSINDEVVFGKWYFTNDEEGDEITLKIGMPLKEYDKKIFTFMLDNLLSEVSNNIEKLADFISD